MEYYNLLHSLNILVARGIKMSAYNTIMEHVNSNRVVVQKIFCGGRATVLMRKFFANSKFLKKELKPIKTGNSLLFYINEDGLHPFVQSIKFRENDLIVLFCTNDNQDEIEWIYGL